MPCTTDAKASFRCPSIPLYADLVSLLQTVDGQSGRDMLGWFTGPNLYEHHRIFLASLLLFHINLRDGSIPDNPILGATVQRISASAYGSTPTPTAIEYRHISTPYKDPDIKKRLAGSLAHSAVSLNLNMFVGLVVQTPGAQPVASLVSLHNWCKIPAPASCCGQVL